MAEKVLYSAGEAETEQIAYELAAQLKAGDTLALYGEMGAGKSVLTRAAARGLGIVGPVPSPTFTILNIHEGRSMRLYHFDLYRLADAEGLWEIGWEDYLLSGALCVLEWSERFDEPFPEGTVYLRFEKTGENSRRIRVEGAENLC